MWFSSKHQTRWARAVGLVTALFTGLMILGVVTTAPKPGHAHHLWALIPPVLLVGATCWWLLVQVPRQGVAVEHDEVAVVNSFRTRRFPIDAVERFAFDPRLSVAYLVQTSGERVYAWGLQQARFGHDPGQAEVLVADINDALEARRASVRRHAVA